MISLDVRRAVLGYYELLQVRCGEVEQKRSNRNGLPGLWKPGRGVEKMGVGRAGILLGIMLASALAGFAQTNVTTTGGTSGYVPVFNGTATVTNSVITQSGGNVGIGTTAPSYPLHIVTSSAATGFDIDFSDNGQLTLRRTSSPAATASFQVTNNGASIVSSSNFTISTTSGGAHYYPLNISGAGNIGIGNNINAPSANRLLVQGIGTGTGSTLNVTDSANNSHFDVLDNGNVGIGTTSPAAKLDVNGSINISGSGAGITFPNGGGTQSVAWTGVLCGGDYAEAVDVSGKRSNYSPGDVLVISAASGSDVAKSSGPYSTLVLGVYATKPGVVGRRQTTDAKTSTTEVPMAMVGIVPTKVSTENGPIRRGDLLVTSSTVGYAMKGIDRSKMLGAVIGKALGSLDSGAGVIEVAVTLQ